VCVMYYTLEITMNNLANAMEPIEAEGGIIGNAELLTEGELLLGGVDELFDIALHELCDDHELARPGAGAKA